jgi:hypothetical protein
VKTTVFTCLSVLLCASTAFAQLSVDREELKKGKDVEFVNYSGPYDTVNTYEEILNIGVSIGKSFRKESFRASYANHYSIIHVYDPADKSGKYDADIFVIEPGGFIDHIRNVRTILVGYLATAYGYSPDDAKLLARFITLYNAVFRGNVAYFKTVYKDAVMKHLSAADAGLSLTYSDWPGRTRILIPLSEGFEKGKLSSIDTQKLTEEEVKDTLRRDTDKGIEDRKKIVELQEKQLEEKDKGLKEDKKKLADDKKELAEEKKKLEEEKKRTGETEATRKKEEEIKKKEEEIRKTETDIARREDAAKKAEEKLRTDRGEIAKEERDLTEKTASTTATLDSVSAEKGLFLRVQSGQENEAGEVVLYNFKKGDTEAKSQGLRVKERRIFTYHQQPLVVAEADGKPGAFLMSLDGKTLAVTAQSKEEVFKNTVIDFQANAVYAVVKRGSQYFVGRFDTSLALTDISKDEVIPFTPLTVYGPYLYVQAKSGMVLRLNITDLSTKDTAQVR